MQTVFGKLVVLGDQGVGKTSIVLRYIEKSFNSYVSSTIGASFFTCKFSIDNITIKLQIWDTAGQERFKAMVPMFYRNANAALLVFDLTAPKSFESMKNWVLELRGNVEQPMLLCVVANKLDLTEERMVSREESMQYANSIGASYFECSAKEDQSIEQTFLSIATGIVRLTNANLAKNLRMYESGGDSAMMAISSDLQATDIGRIEEPGSSIIAVAHASEVKPSKCC